MARIRFDEVRSWLFDQAWPFWAARGVDHRDGGFVEHLDRAGADGGAPYKRTRAQARQVYCFSQAALMGWAPGRAAADSGWRFLWEHGRLPDGRWARRMGRAGGVLDATADSYDIAFVLFAHAWRYRLAPDPAVLESALATIEALDRSLGRAEGPGWLAEEGADAPLQQNPHMHLMEAAVELALATREPRFAALAQRIGTLANQHLFGDGSGVLHEFFGPDWTPMEGPRGRIVEPGHQMEWTWIFFRALPVLGPAVAETARTLYAFAERHGVHPVTGLIYDQIDRTGAVLMPHHRSWPQTEALKAHLARLEHDGLDTRERIATCVDNLLDRYLATEPRGTWIDHLTDEGAPMIDRIPSTTLYHLQLAFSELLRLQPQIEAFADRPAHTTLG